VSFSVRVNLRDPRAGKDRDYRREPWKGAACGARVPLGRPTTTRCRQATDTRSFTDSHGQQRFYCPKPGYEADVRDQARHDDEVRR
jgi:hypothetical protein